MRLSRTLRSVSIAVAGTLTAVWLAFSPGPQSATAQPAERQINDELLRTGSTSGEEWFAYGTNWSEQRYSPLDEINDGNIDRLGVAWSYDLPESPQGTQGTHPEGTPLVFDGVLYSIAPWSIVYAVDLDTGKEIWSKDPDVNQSVWRSRICCGVVNRGIALYEGKVIAPVVDGRLRALDMKTGDLLWETRVSPADQPYTITMAPRVIGGGKVIVGVSGGEYGIRGFFDAYDVNTGKQLWRFYTVPGDPSKPFENEAMERAAKTWSGEWWKIGGGAPVWNGIAYDPDLDLVYVGTGQPAPWTSYYRGKGDNLYASSLLAVNATTGKLEWYYQEVPGDDWDYDAIADIMLADLTIDGQQRKVLMHAPKSAFFYVLDRATGEVISADPITKVSWATGIDPKTGRPIVNPEAHYGLDPVTVKPGPSGGHVWPPWSYSPKTGYVYIPGTAGGSATYRASEDFEVSPTDVGLEGRGLMNMGAGLGGGQLNTKGKGKGKAKGKGGDELPDAVADAQGASKAEAGPKVLPDWGPDGVTGNVLYAWDPIARKEAWRAEGGGAGPFSGGSLATGGNLAMTSVNDTLKIYNATTGKLLREVVTGMSQMGPPISFSVNGKQYITISGAPPRNAGRGDNPSQPSRLIALTLDGDQPMPGVE